VTLGFSSSPDDKVVGMDFSVDRCRRRPVTRRSLVYLDSSTFDAIAKRDEAAVEITDALTRALEEERAICVCSPWHEDELALMHPGPTLNAVVRVVRTYTRELQMRPESELMSAELYAAAQEFSGEPTDPSWREAFRDDPDDPPLNAFQAQWMNERDEPESRPVGAEDAEHDRRTSERLNEAHLELRGEHTWEEIAEGNLRQQVRHYLAPLAARG
jgi:hypothetical protein